VLKILATVIRQGRQMKGIQLGNEEVTLFLFANDMILYFKNSKDSARKILDLINTFRKVARYKNNM
jgi:hypothetical protein